VNLKALKAIILAGEWAIAPSWHAIGEAVMADDGSTVEALLARRGEQVRGSQLTESREGVAVLKIHGPIFHRASLMATLCDAPSAAMLRREFEVAVSDPQVKAIVFDIDSPGGAVGGIAELGDAIYAARGKKPMVAYVGDLGASAAYWIASSADEVVANKTASLGSIGVVAAYRRAGDDKTVEFVSTQSPKKRLNPDSESGRAAIQAHIDTLADLFIADVARNRGFDAARVRVDFGQGDLIVGQRAVDAGLADRLGSLEEVIAELAGGEWAMKRKRKTTAGATADSGENTMADKNQNLWDRIKARLGGKDDDAAVADAVAAEAEAAEKRATAAEAETQRLRQELAKERSGKARGEAEAFVAAQVKAGRVLPAQASALTEDYVQAAEDDAALPREGESRVSKFRARVEGQSAHKLFEDRAPSADLITLNPDAAGDEDAKLKATEEAARKYARSMNRTAAK
jgi:capsid assembly protease